jgi:hypothetical protein
MVNVTSAVSNGTDLSCTAETTGHILTFARTSTSANSSVVHTAATTVIAATSSFVLVASSLPGASPSNQWFQRQMSIAKMSRNHQSIQSNRLQFEIPRRPYGIVVCYDHRSDRCFKITKTSTSINIIVTTSGKYIPPFCLS